MEQDWKPIILRGATSNRVKKTSMSSFTTHHDSKLRKLDNDMDIVERKTTVDVRTTIQRGRTAMGLSQKQLANRMNEPENIVKDLESGKLNNPSPQLVAKLKRTLNVNFSLS
jgi:ribosome-binding protein aMBF1 (putative translation factor)